MLLKLLLFYLLLKIINIKYLLIYLIFVNISNKYLYRWKYFVFILTFPYNLIICAITLLKFKLKKIRIFKYILWNEMKLKTKYINFKKRIKDHYKKRKMIIRIKKASDNISKQCIKK